VTANPLIGAGGLSARGENPSDDCRRDARHGDLDAYAAHTAAHVPLAALPDGKAEEFVTHALDATRPRPAQAAPGQSVSWRSRQAIRDCNDHSSMKPGDAAWEKRPPDSEKVASWAS
jgi:hypothetical protein